MLLRFIDSLMEAESLSEVDKSTLLHHLLRTIWLYGTPDLMHGYYAVLRRHCVGRPHNGELQVALAAIARGAGLIDGAFIHYKRAQLPRFTLPTRLEAYLGAFLITIEKNTLASEFKSTYTSSDTATGSPTPNFLFSSCASSLRPIHPMHAIIPYGRSGKPS